MLLIGQARIIKKCGETEHKRDGDGKTSQPDLEKEEHPPRSRGGTELDEENPKFEARNPNP